MKIPSFGSLQFGTPEWLEYWEDNPKKEAIEFLEFMSGKYLEKEAEVQKLQKMVDWLATHLSVPSQNGKKWKGYLDETDRWHVLFDTQDQATKDWIDAARKASQNEA